MKVEGKMTEAQDCGLKRRGWDVNSLAALACGTGTQRAISSPDNSEMPVLARINND